MSKGRFTQLHRDACWARAKGHCEVCGVPLPEKGWNLHHRQGRGMGGSRRPVDCSDGLVICGNGNTSGCHKRIDDFRGWAEANGFVVPRLGGQLPLEVPVNTALRGWVYFRADGQTFPAYGTEVG